jgi:hypothetical protein
MDGTGVSTPEQGSRATTAEAGTNQLGLGRQTGHQTGHHPATQQT